MTNPSSRNGSKDLQRGLRRGREGKKEVREVGRRAPLGRCRKSRYKQTEGRGEEGRKEGKKTIEGENVGAVRT